MKRAVFAFVLALGACSPVSVPPDAAPFDGSAPYDAGPVDPDCRSACASLARAGCQEGAPACEGTCTHAVASQLSSLPLACFTAATTKEQVRACGRIDCP